jgi:integrase
LAFSAGAGAESVAKATKVLSQILDRAVALELLSQNPAQTLEQPKYQRISKTSATVEQVEAIRAQMDPGRDCLVSFLAYVGPRPMEALALTWEDIEGDRASITKALTDGTIKSTKTRRNRGVVLPRNVVHDLRLWKLKSGHSTGLIWRRPKDIAPWRQHDWDHWRARSFKPPAESKGLKGFAPAELRHTAASLWIAAGRPVSEVAAQLGNSAVVVLGRYQHLIDLYQGREILNVDERIDQVHRPQAGRSA